VAASIPVSQPGPRLLDQLSVRRLEGLDKLPFEEGGAFGPGSSAPLITLANRLLPLPIARRSHARSLAQLPSRKPEGPRRRHGLRLGYFRDHAWFIMILTPLRETGSASGGHGPRGKTGVPYVGNHGMIAPWPRSSVSGAAPR
jgi:hypothetical protein